MDANGKTTTYNYDENGNSTGAVMTVDGLTMNSAQTKYSWNYIENTTDALGNITRYGYNQYTGNLHSVIDPAGTQTTYTYNAQNDQLTSVSSSGSEVDYTYSYSKLSSISHNTDSNSENNVTYNFVYDEFGNTSSVKVGSQALITHTYAANNGLLTQSTYGNGDTYTPTYDSLDRITAVSYNGIEKYNWIYGADGRIGLRNDLVNDVTWRYEYTKDGALTSAYGTNGERFDYTYEPSTGKLLTATVSDETTSKTTTYNYSDHTNGEDANLIESVVLPTATVTYDYDGFYRASYDVEVSGSDILTTDYTFVDGVAENSTTTLVESMTISGSDWSDTLSYTYDCKGNIETISENGEQKAKYYYDDLNQLVREDNAWTNKTVVYNYDNGGNILSVSEYSLTNASDISALVASSTDVYAYGDSNWKDKLTSFNGNTITYDEIGNPLNYYNGYEFDWQNGRQLVSISATDLDVSYTYDANGIRTSKTVNGVTTTYTLEGSNIVKETNGTDTIWYYYDAAGSLTGFELNGTPCFYVSNIQGDIVAITNADGNIVVEYVYDSWGKLISITGSLADTVGIKNPYRYRGYYYDTETGLYYLNNRYYDSNNKRFINSDMYISAVCGNLKGYNSFVYCFNDPINMVDPFGNWPTVSKDIKKIIKNTVIAVAKSVLKDYLVKHDVPLYSQGKTSLCWAYCQVMVEDYLNDVIKTQEEADARAIEIAKSIDETNWNKGGWPTNLGDRIYVSEITDINTLYNELQDGPIYAYYDNPDITGDAHLVVVTGVNCLTNKVFTNNPWGISGSQTFDEFLRGYEGGDGNSPLSRLYKIM